MKHGEQPTCVDNARYVQNVYFTGAKDKLKEAQARVTNQTRYSFPGAEEKLKEARDYINARVDQQNTLQFSRCRRKAKRGK